MKRITAVLEQTITIDMVKRYALSCGFNIGCMQSTGSIRYEIAHNWKYNCIPESYYVNGKRIVDML